MGTSLLHQEVKYVRDKSSLALEVSAKPRTYVLQGSRSGIFQKNVEGLGSCVIGHSQGSLSVTAGGGDWGHIGYQSWGV